MISVSQVSVFYALLAIVANVFVLWFFAVVLASRVSEPARLGWEQTRRTITPYVLAGAWIVAMLATLGSLYYSEIAGFEPCRLCWYQRIAMYPLVVILAIAALRRDIGVRHYAIPVAAIGAIISSYHYVLEWFPAVATAACSVGVPCTLVWFREFGFISLPYLALSAFLLVITLLLIPRRERHPDPSAAPTERGGGPS